MRHIVIVCLAISNLSMVTQRCVYLATLSLSTSPAEPNNIQQQPQHNQQSNLHHMHLQELAPRLHQTQGQSSPITQQESQQQHSDNIQNHNSPVKSQQQQKIFYYQPHHHGMRAEQVRVNQHQTSQFQLQNQYTQHEQLTEQMSQQYAYDSMSQHHSMHMIACHSITVCI